MEEDTYQPFAKLGQFLQMFENDSPSETPDLHRLARDGNKTQLSELLQNGCDVNEEDEKGLTALYIATDRGHTKIVEILLKNGANVNTKRNPLHVVQNLQCAELLVKAKGDLCARDEFGNSPLQTATRPGKENIIEYFITIGADIHSTNAKGETPLHTLCSAFMGQSHIAERLIKMGANVNHKDSQKRSPLHVAVLHYNDKYETANVLIQAGASVTDLDLQGLDPIHHFIETSKGCTEDDAEMCIRYIDLLVVDENAANSTNEIGQTILHLAMPEVKVQVLGYLVKKGCRLNVVDGRKRSLLHYLPQRKNFTDVLNYLLEKGLDIDCCDVWGQTSLHFAVEKNNQKLVEALVENGADVNIKDSVSRQAIHIAAENGWHLICDFLIKNGADINAQDKYQSTPLHLAAYNDQPSIADTLIRADCDIACRDVSGKTAKEVAEFRSSFDFLRVLQEHDGDDHPQEQNGKLSKYAYELLPLKAFQDIIESTEEKLRESGDLNEYLCRIISKPTIGTVFEDPEAVEIRQVVDGFAMNVAKCISESHPKMRCTLFPAGSSSEGTKVKYPNEFDYIVCLDELSENIYPEHEMEDVLESVCLISSKERNEERKGMLVEGEDYKNVYASVSDYTRIFLKQNASHLYSEYIDMDSRMVPTHMMFQTFTHLVTNIVFREAFPKDNRLLITDVSNDPKFSLQWRGCKYKSLDIDVDFVPAVRLPAWPGKSRIHSKLLDADLLSLPCLAVPKTTSQEDRDLWRLSLSLVETAIMRRCLPRIRNSYIVAKTMINSYVCPIVSFDDYEEAKMYFRSEHDSLSSDEEFELYEHVEGLLHSYPLKMAFLHSIEEKAVKDGIETVFDGYVQDESDHEMALQSEIASEELDSEIVKDIFKKCDVWLSDQFVPSFLNPRHNVLGSRMLEGDDAKVLYFIKYIKKLLDEK